MDILFDLIIIGGGQAGLAAAYFAQQNKLNYLVLDAGSSIGESWHKRYDSLKLFTPRSHSNLPGMDMPGDKNEYPGKDEVVEYFRQYQKQFNLNIRLNEPVVQLTKDNDEFSIASKNGSYRAKQVIVATGSFQKPHTPKWATSLPKIQQLHSSEYHNPSQIKGENVLVIGGGNSGAQIAEELAHTRHVTLSTKTIPPVCISLRFFGRSIFWWMDVLHLWQTPADSWRAKFLRKPIPIISNTLPDLLGSEVIALMPEAIGVQNNNAVLLSDGSSGYFDTIIYATGYSHDYSWIDIPQSLAKDGMPVHTKGVSTEISGLYYLGLDWMRSLSSALLGGVGADAEYIVGLISQSVK